MTARSSGMLYLFAERALRSGQDLSEEAVVSTEAIESARLRAAEYAEHLKTPRIGFREPDRVNLERAMIVASAQLGQATGDFCH